MPIYFVKAETQLNFNQQELQMTKLKKAITSTLGLLALSTALNVNASVPREVQVQTPRSEKFQDFPQGIEHWQVFAREEAAKIATKLKQSGVYELSVDKDEKNSVFEVLYFDYLVSELHHQGVNLVYGKPGAASLHVHSYLVVHEQKRKSHKLPYEDKKGKRPMGKKVSKAELALHVKVLEGGHVKFANSKNLYLSPADLDLFKYHSLKKSNSQSTDVRKVPVLGE